MLDQTDPFDLILFSCSFMTFASPDLFCRMNLATLRCLPLLAPWALAAALLLPLEVRPDLESSLDLGRMRVSGGGEPYLCDIHGEGFGFYPWQHLQLEELG